MFIPIVVSKSLFTYRPPPSYNMSLIQPATSDRNDTPRTTKNRKKERLIRASEIYDTPMAENRTEIRSFPIALRQALNELKFERTQKQSIPDRTNENEAATTTTHKNNQVPTASIHGAVNISQAKSDSFTDTDSARFTSQNL